MAVVPGQFPATIDSSIASNNEKESNTERPIIVHKHSHFHRVASPIQRAQSSAMKHELELKTGRIHDAERKLKRLQAAAEEFEAADHAKDDEIKRTKAELDGVRSELEIVREKLGVAQTSLATKEIDLAAEMAKLQREEGSTKAMQVTIKRLEAELAELKEKNRTLEEAQASRKVSSEVVESDRDAYPSKSSNGTSASRKASKDKRGQKQHRYSKIEDLELIDGFNEADSVIQKEASLSILSSLREK